MVPSNLWAEQMIKSRSRFVSEKHGSLSSEANRVEGFRVELDGVSAVIEVCRWNIFRLVKVVPRGLSQVK